MVGCPFIGYCGVSLFYFFWYKSINRIVQTDIAALFCAHILCVELYHIIQRRDPGGLLHSGFHPVKGKVWFSR